MNKDWNIDRAFIAAQEGAGIKKGYVPAAGGSKSGVTIATGVDLGQRKPSEIDGWALSSDLRLKLRGYCGLRGQDAVELLKNHPLEVTAEDCDAIDDAAAEPLFRALASAYDIAVGPDRFDALPRAVRTVITSVAYQYGPRLATRTPKFWQAAIAEDWNRVIRELRNFGDAYPSRRKREADYLQKAMENDFGRI